jgi:hypothetical protein
VEDRCRTTEPRLAEPAAAGGADAIRSLYNPNRNAPDPRNLQDFIRPVDRNTIQDIQAAIASGLDPSQAASLLQGIGSGIDTRFGTYQQNRQDARSQAQDALMQLAQTNANPAAAQTYIDSYAQLHPNMGTNGLENLAGSLYPGRRLLAAVLGRPESGRRRRRHHARRPRRRLPGRHDVRAGRPDQRRDPAADLHDARMRIVGQLRAQGYSDADIATAYDAIGRAYQAVGGQVNAPLTSSGPTQRYGAGAGRRRQPRLRRATRAGPPQAAVGNPLQGSMQGALSALAMTHAATANDSPRSRSSEPTSVGVADPSADLRAGRSFTTQLCGHSAATARPVRATRPADT